MKGAFELANGKIAPYQQCRLGRKLISIRTNCFANEFTCVAKIMLMERRVLKRFQCYFNFIRTQGSSNNAKHHSKSSYSNTTLYSSFAKAGTLRTQQKEQ